MKELIIGASIVAVMLIGLGFACAYNTEDRSADQLWAYHGKCVKTVVVEIDGHKYVLAAGDHGIAIVHSASCGCSNAVC